MSQSALAYTPMLTDASPFSMRISVGTETPMRIAHDRCDSLRRFLAMARFSPSCLSAEAAIGGRDSATTDDFGIT